MCGLNKRRRVNEASMLVFTSVSVVRTSPKHVPPHVESGSVSRGLVIGWQARMTWVLLEDHQERA
jgi:hypothetical protein